MRVDELAERIAKGDPAVSRHQGIFIVDERALLKGIITRADMLRALDKDQTGNMTVLQAGNAHVIVAFPDESLHEAAAKLLRQNIGRLPVVERQNHQRVVGYLGRREIMAARMRRLDAEHVLEPGWLARFRKHDPRRT
jgi:CBS domain-containing protein